MFNFDRRTIYIVLAILIIMNLAQYLTDSQALLGLVLTLPGVIIAITFHEFAHAFAADRQINKKQPHPVQNRRILIAI